MDPCRNLTRIDFNNQDHLKKILMRDKHTRIEGICTEHLFVNELIKNTFRDYSTGWWFRLRNNSYRVIRFLPKINHASELDFFILDHFKDKGIKSFIVSFDETENSFFYIDYQKTNSRAINEKRGAVMIGSNKKRRPPPIPKISERNARRLKQAISLLQSYDALKDAALERVFANCFLTGAYWDIDTFVLHEGKILAFEVKQKFPTAKGTFGLNTGLVNLFSFLTRSGIEVFHIILTKPTRNDRIPAIDLYTKSEYKNKVKWIGLKFSPNLLANRSSVAPAKTSIFGASNLKYYHISPDSFHFIKKLGEANPQKLLDFVNEAYCHK